MSLRALLNRVHVLLRQNLDEEGRAELDAQMADPDGWHAARQKQVLKELAAVGEVG